MCGLSGFFDSSSRTPAREWAVAAGRMADALRHRGPDDSGVWTDPDAGIALSHRRLSILDLSVEGHQPMFSSCGRYALVFNGEIYNFLELTRELAEAGHRFRGHSDTEVMLAAFVHWGVAGALKRFVGMFAFALWDRMERTLHLARDRIGEKPLYYGWSGGVFLIGSELKALRAHPRWQGEIDRDALALFMRHNYIPAPHSIYRGILKLPPGTFLSLRTASAQVGSLPGPVSYWDLKSVAEAGVRHPFDGNEIEAAGRLEAVLRESIAKQMVADVPLGAFLSGGVDSSTVVALMQAQSSRRIKTFTIGFHEREYNEAPYAKAVASHLGTNHTELYVTPKEALGVIQHLPTIYDEPFSDSSQIPTFLVSELARRHVTVSLSGDAGDELFGGYLRYPLAQRIWNRVGWIPRTGRNAISTILRSLKPETWERTLGWASKFASDPVWSERIGDRLHKLADILAAETPDQIYRGLVSHWKEPDQLVLGSREPATVLNDPARWAEVPGFFERMMYLDTMSYLPDDVLVKVDRAGMAVSLESRIPLLDHRVVEFAWRLPLSMKVRRGREKWLLRQVLYKYVPKNLIERPKKGFGVPIDQWLRGPLRDWAENLLLPDRLKREGFLNPSLVAAKWSEHLSGKRNWQYYLWDVLMFQAWLEAQKPGLR